MADKKRMNINDVVGDSKAPVTTFAEADSVARGEGVNKGGRPVKGSSKATVDVRFKIDAETAEWLMGMTDYKNRTVHAQAKKIIVSQFDLLNK